MSASKKWSPKRMSGIYEDRENSEKSCKFYKIVEMLFELLIDWVVENR